MTYDEPVVYFCSKLLIFNKLKIILIKILNQKISHKFGTN